MASTPTLNLIEVHDRWRGRSKGGVPNAMFLAGDARDVRQRCAADSTNCTSRCPQLPLRWVR
jgi:hypothetical protein